MRLTKHKEQSSLWGWGVRTQRRSHPQLSKGWNGLLRGPTTMTSSARHLLNRFWGSCQGHTALREATTVWREEEIGSVHSWVCGP